MEIRPYQPDDRAACLAIFDSNTPDFCKPEEGEGFERLLDTMPCAYLVMEHDGAILGCGGYYVTEEKSVARLVWGMVRRDMHRHGLGRFLLLFRLREIGRTGDVQMVTLGTSQHTAPFFERQGFKVVQIARDAYAPGLDRIEMTMKLAVCP
jgi:GNAT superfamily N-acetyltransferase